MAFFAGYLALSQDSIQASLCRWCPALALTAAGLCVSLVPGDLCSPQPEGIQLFCMPGHPQWALEAVTRKDAYLSKAARRFLQMVKEHFA